MSLAGFKYLLNMDAVWLITSGLSLLLAVIVVIIGRAIWEESACIGARRTARCHAFADRNKHEPCMHAPAG